MAAKRSVLPGYADVAHAAAEIRAGRDRSEVGRAGSPSPTMNALAMQLACRSRLGPVIESRGSRKMTRSPGNVGSGGSVSGSSMNPMLRTALPTLSGPASDRPGHESVHGTARKRAIC